MDDYTCKMDKILGLDNNNPIVRCMSNENKRSYLGLRRIGYSYLQEAHEIYMIEYERLMSEMSLNE